MNRTESRDLLGGRVGGREDACFTGAIFVKRKREREKEEKRKEGREGRWEGGMNG